MAPTPWVFFRGAIFGIFWHVLGDVSQHDTTVGHNFRPDALVKPPTNMVSQQSTLNIE